jgi:hypothetical protein
MSEDANSFRKQAKEATEQAAKSLSPLNKAEWLKLALSDESRK